MSPVLRLAPLLARGRHSTDQGRIDLLSIAAFAVSIALIEMVLGGVHAFWLRSQRLPAALLAVVPSREIEDAGFFWVLLAAVASVMLLMPLATLAAASARMGALGRERRLATLRLLGATPADVVVLTAAETVLQALAGAALGTLVYLVSLPAWSLLSFQATPLSASEMLLPPAWLAAALAVTVLIAAVSGTLALRQVRISPLGVARRAQHPGVRRRRLLALVLVVGGWLVFGPILLRSTDMAVAIAFTLVFLAAFMGVINLVGPLLVRALGALQVGLGSPATLLSGRRLLADPKGAWRSVAGLVAVGFVAGALLAMPTDVSDDPLDRIILTDLQTGANLTVAIAFVVAATSTMLNQVAGVLDRREETIALHHLGTSPALFSRVRSHEVIGPTLGASVGSAGLAVAFFVAVLGRLDASPAAVLTLVGLLAAGVTLVWAASQACRPLVRDVLHNATPRVD